MHFFFLINENKLQFNLSKLTQEITKSLTGLLIFNDNILVYH